MFNKSENKLNFRQKHGYYGEGTSWYLKMMVRVNDER